MYATMSVSKPKETLMCIPHGTHTMKQSPSKIRKENKKKHIQMVSKDLFEHGDPDFIDERTIPYEQKKKKSWILRFFG